MSILYQAEGVFCEGKLDYVWKEHIYYVDVKIKNDGLYFEGKIKQTENFYKNSTGFNYNIPLSDISKLYKSKVKLVHVVVIKKTNGKIYNLALINEHSTLGKKNAKQFVKLYHQFITGLQINYCPNCGNAVEGKSLVCRNCGKKLK